MVPDSRSTAAERDLREARETLNSAGLGCHKEQVGLPCMLGYEVVVG